MKKILCFGDSNTYGFIPESGKRYDKSTRWTGILADISGFEIIEAGCNNRTGFSDNPAGKMQTGYKILPEILSADLDCVILAIGINDLQIFYNPTLNEIKAGIENLIKIIRSKCPAAKILIAAPSKLTEDIFNGYFQTMFNRGSIEKSFKLGNIYETAAKEGDCLFINLDEVAQVSKLDGLHYTPEAHREIAHAIFKTIENL